MNIFDKPPVNRHGVSTLENPIPKIPVNTVYEMDTEVLDEFYDLPLGNTCAQYPYQLSVFDNHIDIYSGDGRLVATLMRDNFVSFREMIFTARMMAYSHYFYAAAAFAMRDLGMMHNGGKSADKYNYRDEAKIFYNVCKSLTYLGRTGGHTEYEPVRYATAGGYEHETEMALMENENMTREEVANRAQHIILDADLPEIDEEAYKNGYA